MIEYNNFFKVGFVWFLMAGRIEVEVERCKGCGLCVYVCKKDVLEMTFGRKTNEVGLIYAVVKYGERCNGCGDCYQVCGDYCITVFRD